MKNTPRHCEGLPEAIQHNNFYGLLRHSVPRNDEKQEKQ